LTITGIGYRKFEVNTPPKPGSCLVTPDNGTALVTLYNVECPIAFEDVHEPFTYEISTLAGGYKPGYADNDYAGAQWTFFHKGTSYSFPGLLRRVAIIFLKLLSLKLVGVVVARTYVRKSFLQQALNISHKT